MLVTEGGDVYYAGWREVGSFTQGGGSHGASPVLKNKGVKQASIMFSNLLMVTESGQVYVYGLDQGGAIGGAVTGGTPSTLSLTGVKQVAAGYNFSAFLMNNGSVKILGDNSNGQHGQNNTSAVTGFSTVTIN